MPNKKGAILRAENVSSEMDTKNPFEPKGGLGTGFLEKAKEAIKKRKKEQAKQLNN